MAKTPVRYSPEIAARILEMLAAGQSLRAICRNDWAPDESAVRQWVLDNTNGFAPHYARARDKGYDALAEEIIEIADDGTNDFVASNDPDNPGYKFNGEHSQRSKLRVDTRKWLLAKMRPKVYGDLQQLEVKGSLDIAQRIAAARKRSTPSEDSSDLV